MKQDLFDWLNSTHTSNTHDEGTAENVDPPLLLAPVWGEQHDEPPESESPHPEIFHSESSAYSAPVKTHITAFNEAWQGTFTEEYTVPEEISTNEQIDTPAPENGTDIHDYASAPKNGTNVHAYTPESENVTNVHDYAPAQENGTDIHAYTPAPENVTNVHAYTPAPENGTDVHDYTPAPENGTDIHAYASAPENVTDIHAYTQESPSFPDEHHTSILNQAWHEAAAFTINLNEPPQEMWTDIDSDSDDEPKDYEENMSLQGDAYIPVTKHGANFTQRLQATLQGRKAKAAKRRELDAENASRHPYLQKAVIFCGVLLMALGFAYFGLWFIQRETPDGINQRAVNLYEQGNFDEAEALYHRAYTRYPHVLGFLTGMARSAEKAGHTQTAIAAWNEYVSSLPKDDTEHRRAAQEELDRLIPGHARKISQTVTLPQKTTRPSQQTVPAPARPQLPNVRALTFEEALTEANNAYNIGMFSRAIANFHKAHAIRENDIRPYIGLAASYRAKGLYFDAKRMLDEARHKFGINPTIDVERYYLRRE